MLSVKNPQVDTLVSHLARISGESKTQLVLQGLQLLEKQLVQESATNSISTELMAAGERIKRLSKGKYQTVEEVLGYDEGGLPS